MDNLARNLGALSIEELEAQRLQLREELQQIEQQIEIVQQVEITIRDAVAAIEKYQQRLKEFAPGAKQRLWEAILKCKNEPVPTLFEQWDAAKNAQTPTASSSGGAEEDALDNLNKLSGLKDFKVIENDDAPAYEDAEDDEAFNQYVGEPVEQEVRLGTELALEEPQITRSLPASDTYAEFVNLNPQVGYLRRVDDGAILSAYLGGKNKTLLEVWARCVSAEVANAGGKCEYEVRPAQRLKNSKHEVKFRHISFAVLESLTAIDTSKSPKFRATDKNDVLSEKHSATGAVPSEERESVTSESGSESLALRVGDRVLIKSDRHGQEFVNKVGIVSAPTKIGAAINVGGTLKYFHLDEVKMMERSTKVRNPADDLSVSVSTPLDLTDDSMPW